MRAGLRPNAVMSSAAMSGHPMPGSSDQPIFVCLYLSGDTMTDRLLHLLQELASRFSSPAATAEEALAAGPLVGKLEQAAKAFVPDTEELPRLRQ